MSPCISTCLKDPSNDNKGVFDTPEMTEAARDINTVHSIPTLDTYGRQLAQKVQDTILTPQQASFLLAHAIMRTQLVTYVVKDYLIDKKLTGGHHPVRTPELITRVTARLDEKTRAVNSDGKPYLDWERMLTSKVSAWARTNAHLLAQDALRSLVRHRELFDGGGEGGLPHHSQMGQRSRAPEDMTDRQERIDLVFAMATLDARGRNRRLTSCAVTHISAKMLHLSEQWPDLVMPVTWAEREQVRQVLTDNPGIALESLTDPFAPDVPVALAALWDNFDHNTRRMLAEKRPRLCEGDDGSGAQAHRLALAAVTPFPRPSRKAGFGVFRAAVEDLSPDPGWRARARGLADAWCGVFVSLETFQSRASTQSVAGRLAEAERQRKEWDELVLGRLPREVERVAGTATDLAALLARVWLETNPLLRDEDGGCEGMAELMATLA